MTRTDSNKGGAAARAKAPGGNGLSRGKVAAWLAALLLLVVSAGRWDSLLYPHYLGAIALQCAVLLLTVLWACPGGPPLRVGRRDIPLIAPYAAYGLYTVLSCAWAFNPHLALAGGAVQMAFPLIWAIGLGLLLRSAEQVRTVLRAVFVAGVVAACAGLFYVLRDHSIEAVEMVQGQRNFLATFLIPPITAGLADLLFPLLVRAPVSWRPLQWPRSLVVLGILPMAAAMGMVFSRSVGGLLGLLAAAVCLLAIRLSWRRRLMIVALVLFLVVAAIVVLSVRPPPVSAWMMKHSSVATRWFMWQGAVRMILDRPLAGWGPGNFILAFADYKPTEPMRFGWLGNLTIYPHNELLLVAAEGGLLALLLYLAAHVLVARGVIRSAERSARPEIRLLGWTLLGAALGMFVHGQVDVVLRFWAPSAMFWTLIGLLIAAARLEGNAEYGTRNAEVGRSQFAFRIPRSAIRILLLIFVAAAALVVVWPGARAERLLGAGGEENGGRTPEKVAQNCAEAARLSRYVPDYLFALQEKASALWQGGERNAAISSCEEFERVAPGCGNLRETLGDWYFFQAREIGPRDEAAAQADLRKAAAWLERAVAQFPYHVSPRLSLANVLLQASGRNLPAALDQVNAAVRAEPDSAEARLLLGTLLAESGKKEEALAELDKAAALTSPASTLGRQAREIREAVRAAPSGGQ